MSSAAPAPSAPRPYVGGPPSRFTASAQTLSGLLGDDWVTVALSPEVAASEARTRAQAFAAAASDLIADSRGQQRDQASILLGRA